MSYRKKHGRRIEVDSPERVFKLLPDDCRSFDAWLYSSDPDRDGVAMGAATGLRDYYRAVQEWLNTYFEDRPGEVLPAQRVAAAGGLTAAEWYRLMFARGPRIRAV